MIKVLTVFGTRPEAIKMAPVIRCLNQHPDKIVSKVCVTAQHRQMLDQVLTLFQIVPDYDLDLMRHKQSLIQVAAAILTALEPILSQEKPDWVLVQGDTTTVMAASLAAFYTGVKVGHIEAGLRSHDKWHPFPEEINRKITGTLADLHFAPTENAKQNLLRQATPSSQVLVTGNTVIDALYWSRNLPFNMSGTILENLDPKKKLVLVTAHRRENFGNPIEQICLALRDLAKKYEQEVQILYPVHPNPWIQEPVRRILGEVPSIKLSDPLDYITLVNILSRATLVLTDSGGIQEEAPSFGVPVLVLRDVTERPEAVEAGTVRLVGTQREAIFSVAERLLTEPAEYTKMARAVNPYGDGAASERIVNALLSWR